MLWYHDHAMGINRLNIFAGLLSTFIIRDETEAAFNLPAGKYEIPLVIYDCKFDRDGQLYYPVSPNPASPWVSEFFGDVMLVNGKVSPILGSGTSEVSLSASQRRECPVFSSDAGQRPPVPSDWG